MLRLEGIVLAPEAPPFDHEFQPGTMSVVLGRNRSGKTRLCRLLAGLEPLTHGSVRLDGAEIGRHGPGERPVALVYQTFVNYPNLSVAQNIASPMRARRVSSERRRARVAELAERLHITELLDRRPEQLSGGQQQRVAIARALAKEARILVLDEPLVNLDFKLRESFEVELRNMLLGENLVVIYTTSDPRDAFNLGDQVLLLNDHALVQAGPPLAVYQAPNSAVAAGLMSDPGINCWQGDDGVRGVRPEHLDVKRADVTDVSFSAELLGVETNGSETYLHCRLLNRRGGEQHWVARVTGLLANPGKPGERIELFAPVDAILSFPGEQLLG